MSSSNELPVNLEFHLEEHPLVLARPQIVPPYSWVGHIPFAYLAMDLLRPGCLVELGTHSGNSYMAFCQAVKALNISCRCTAVDAWQGDAHSLHYGEEVYQSLRGRHDPAYGEFSRLIRSHFDDASSQFEAGSIDLLHIDGLHTYEAVGHDFETWLPKLSDRAVVLLHDTQERERGFGVSRFFDELKTHYPCFDFRHSHGLGVVAVGQDVPEAFRAFMHSAQEFPEATRQFFEAVASTLVDINDRPMPAAVIESMPVVCHLFYRDRDEIFDESRMISQPIDAAHAVVDVQFHLPDGVRPDYLRIDPADVPGVFGLSRVMWRQSGQMKASSLAHLPDRVGHVSGELLPVMDSQSLRLISFDADPYIEFEVDSALAEMPADGSLEITIRVEYEVVLLNPLLHQLMEKYSHSLSDMRQLSRERVAVQNLAREFSLQRTDVQNLFRECIDQRRQLDALAYEMGRAREREQVLLQRIEQGIDQLKRRSLWSVVKRLTGRRP